MSEPSRSPTTEPDGASAAALDWGNALAVHDRWLRRVVASRLGEPQAVDEVMQDVALAAVAQRSPLHNPARVAVWLYRLAVRHVLIYRRKAGRRRGLVDRYAARADRLALDAAPSPLGWRAERILSSSRKSPTRSRAFASTSPNGGGAASGSASSPSRKGPGRSASKSRRRPAPATAGPPSRRRARGSPPRSPAPKRRPR